MTQRQVTIGSKVGLHARPASIFARAAAAAPVPVQIAKGGEPVNAKSVLSLLTLGANHGDQVTLFAEGHGADAVLDELVALLGRDLDEEGAEVV
jgi:phosphocarrier protein HPr